MDFAAVASVEISPASLAVHEDSSRGRSTHQSSLFFGPDPEVSLSEGPARSRQRPTPAVGRLSDSTTLSAVRTEKAIERARYVSLKSWVLTHYANRRYAIWRNDCTGKSIWAIH